MLRLFVVLYSISSLAFISTDTAVLMELVTTTASQLNELEKLVSNAEKYTHHMQKYNELAQDEYFRAERIAYLAEDVASKKEVEDLDDLNSAIRNLKYSMSDIKGLIDEYKVIQGNESLVRSKVKVSKKLNTKKSKLARGQVSRAINVKTQSGANRLTAQNTAMLLEQGVEGQNNQLTLIEQGATTNRLLAEELEIKRRREAKRSKFYGVKNEK